MLEIGDLLLGSKHVCVGVCTTYRLHQLHQRFVKTKLKQKQSRYC